VVMLLAEVQRRLQVVTDLRVFSKSLLDKTV